MLYTSYQIILNVEVYSNIYRCFTNVNKLNMLYDLLMVKPHCGVYNIGSPIQSYYDLIKKVCIKHKFNVSNIINTNNYTIVPRTQNMNLKKQDNDFVIRFN